MSILSSHSMHLQFEQITFAIDSMSSEKSRLEHLTDHLNQSRAMFEPPNDEAKNNSNAIIFNHIILASTIGSIGCL